MKIPAFHIGQDQMFGASATNWVGVVSNNLIFVPVKKKQKRNTRFLPKLNADIPFTHNKQFKNTTCQVGIPQCVRNPHCNPTRKFCRKSGANPDGIDQQWTSFWICQAAEDFADDRAQYKSSGYWVKVEGGGGVIKSTCLMAMCESCSVIVELAKALDTRTQLFSLADAKVIKALNRALRLRELVGKKEFSRNWLSLWFLGYATLEGRVRREG